MKIMRELGVSNIAWNSSEDEEIYLLMQQNCYQELEISPAKIQNDCTNITNSELFTFSSTAEEYDIQIVAMQALLFGHPELKIFADRTSRTRTLEYLKKSILIGETLGVDALIFGSPKNRSVPNIKKDTYLKSAQEFFDEIGRYAEEHNVTFCIEPNPSEYGGNFLCTTIETINFVRFLSNDGLKVNLDSGALVMTGEDPARIIRDNSDLIGHVHISEPFLNPIEIDSKIHTTIAALLREMRYPGHISIEMRSVSKSNNRDSVQRVLESVRTLYPEIIRR